MDDQFYMAKALELAELTVGQTSPNPSVGCVVVKNGRIIGVGTHLRAGEPHAEVLAARQAGAEIAGSTVFVTLEPCAHQGKTPPCVDFLIGERVKRVVIATLDENPVTAGKGSRKLQEAGIEVTVGVLEHEARRLNREFFFFQREHRPWVTLKAGVSIDGKIATRTGESRWITGIEAREDGHVLRHRRDAILVGIGTVLADNPSLTTRLPSGGVNPLRVVLDSTCRTPPDSAIVDGTAPTLVFTTDRAPDSRVRSLRAKKVDVVSFPDQITVSGVLEELGERGVLSVLVEGGAAVHGAFLDSRLFEEVVLYVSPKVIGGKAARFPFAGEGIASLEDAMQLEFESVQRIGDDLRLTAVRQGLG